MLSERRLSRGSQRIRAQAISFLGAEAVEKCGGRAKAKESAAARESSTSSSPAKRSGF